jgi:hypothetical protein
MDVTDVMCQVRQNTKLNTKPTQNGSDIIISVPDKIRNYYFGPKWHPTKYETIISAQNGTMAVEFNTKLPNDHKYGIL